MKFAFRDCRAGNRSVRPGDWKLGIERRPWAGARKNRPPSISASYETGYRQPRLSGGKRLYTSRL